MQANRAFSTAVLITAVVLGACTSDSGVSQPVVPTFTLVAATATPVTPTTPPTEAPLMTEAPEITIAPTAAPGLMPTASASAGYENDPVAVELVTIAQHLVAEQTGLPTRRIDVVSVQDLTWRDSSLGCPAPDQSVTQEETPGYRIVIAAGDTQYLFHTDVDRVIPCDFALEVLPEGVILATEEAGTPEVTEAAP